MHETSLRDKQGRLLDTLSDAELMHRILSMPKVELHRHLAGSINGAMAVKIAAKYGVELPSYIASELDEILFGCRKVNTLPEYLAPWATLERLFVSREAIHEIILEVIEQAAKDNVVYLELRMGPYGFLGKEPYTFEEFIHTVSASVAEAESRFGVTTRCILGVPRHVFAGISAYTRNRMFARMISVIYPFFPHTFVGVDLNGDESAAAGDHFKVFFKIAREKGFGITVHAGECGPAQNVEYAVRELNASRIGHGIEAAKSPSVLSCIAESGSMLEICPTSNEILNRVSQAGELPLRLLTEYGVSFAICTDNPARNKVSLSEDLFKVATAFGLNEAHLHELTYSALNRSFADQGTKHAVELALRRRFQALANTEACRDYHNMC